jgi:hypothetical protein
MSFSPSSFLANFSAENQPSIAVKKDSAIRTQPSLLDLFRRESEHGQQFDHNFDHRFNHGGCGSDLRINLEPTREIFDTFKDIEKGIVAFPHVFGRLADACIITG